MSRLMSVAFTEQAVVERRKTVTRRKGWLFVRPGHRITLCRKVMGRKKGEPLVRLVDVEVVSVEREHLSNLTFFPDYGRAEMIREGFPGMDPVQFIREYFVEAQGFDPEDLVTRIEWRYLDTRDDACLRSSGCDGVSHSLRCNDAWYSTARAVTADV